MPAPREGDLSLVACAAAGGALLAGAMLVWLAGQLAALALHRCWPPVPPSGSVAILLRLPSHASEPGAAWPAPARGAVPGPGPVYAVLAVLLVAAGWAATATASWLAPRRKQLRRGERDRSAAWGRPRDIPHLVASGREPDRVVLGTLAGRTVVAEARRSVLVVAPTQAGKTTRFVIPTVARWQGPLVVATVKTDVLRRTYWHRTKMGDGRVRIFDPTGAVDGTGGMETATWSPLSTAKTYADAERTARWLLKAASTGSPDTNGQFWENTAGKLLAPLLFAAANTGGDLGTLTYWLDTKELLEVDRILRRLRDLDASNAWAASCGRDPRTRDSAYASCESLLSAFTTPAVRAATTSRPGSPGIDAAGVLDERQTVYLVGSAADQELLAPLFVALIQSIVREAQRRYTVTGAPLDPPLMLMLDEAAHVAPLPDLPTLAATGAGQGMQVVSVWQDLAQIEDRYGRRARTLVNNHTARVFLPGSADYETLDRLSRLLGDQPVDRDSFSVDEGGRRSRTRSRHEARLAPADYLRTLPPGSALVLYGRDPALRVRTRAWFDDPAMRRVLATEPPHCPQSGGQQVAATAGTAANGSVPPSPPEASMTDRTPTSPAGDPLPLVPGPVHSTMSGLVGDPDRPGYALDADGRRYFLADAADGSTVPIPVELTEAQRAELDAARDRAAIYAEQLTSAEHAGSARIVRMRPRHPDGDP